MSNVSMVDGHIDENKMTDIKKLTEDLEYARYHCTSNKGKDAINDALDLINRQQAEISVKRKLLEKAEETINKQQANNERLHYMNKSKLDTIHDLQAKIERLKEGFASKNLEYSLLERERAEDISDFVEDLKFTKVKAIKEFAERLKEELISYCKTVVEGNDMQGITETGFEKADVMTTIDNLIKEMVGEE